jgi:hypothetical protein
MKQNELERDVAQIGVRLLDEAYFAWLSAARDSEQALRAWMGGADCSRREAYSAYLAALDREEAAARDLQRLSELARPCELALAGA